MVLNIEQDHLRFREIVRGRIKQDLKKYISNSEMIGKKGKDFVSIPIPQIELPTFRFGERQEGIMAKGNNAQKKETKKPKKGTVKAGADSKPKDTKKK